MVLFCIEMRFSPNHYFDFRYMFIPLNGIYVNENSLIVVLVVLSTNAEYLISNNKYCTLCQFFLIVIKVKILSYSVDSVSFTKWDLTVQHAGEVLIFYWFVCPAINFTQCAGNKKHSHDAIVIDIRRHSADNVWQKRMYVSAPCDLFSHVTVSCIVSIVWS